MSAEDKNSPSNEKTPAPARVEDILLERLKNEPEIAPQISKPILFAIIAVVLCVGGATYFLSRKMEKYAVDPHAAAQQQTGADSSAMYSKRMKLQPIIDSLRAIISANPNDDQAHLELANMYYETEYWDKAKTEYEAYLGKHSEDPDARVDYAFTLAQLTGDFKASVEEIKKALKYAPDHINALFNAGIMSIRANLDDKQKAVAEATPFFNRALEAAKKQGNEKMASQIEKVMAELKELKEATK